MSLNPRKSLTVFSALSACLAFFFAAWLPVWTVRIGLSDPPTRSRRGSFFESLLSLSAESEVGQLVAHEDLLLKTVAILLAGAVLGRLSYWLLWERAVSCQAHQDVALRGAWLRSWRFWRFWGWFALLLMTFALLNLVGTSLKGTRFYGLPFRFAVHWQGTQSSPPRWEFEPGKLLLDIVIGLFVSGLLAWVCTVSRPRISPPPA